MHNLAYIHAHLSLNTPSFQTNNIYSILSVPLKKLLGQNSVNRLTIIFSKSLLVISVPQATLIVVAKIIWETVPLTRIMSG